MTFWQDRNVYVTGATGLLGSWLAEELVENGAKVVCLMRDWVPGSRFFERGLADRVNIVRGELEDFSLLVRSINEYEIDSVFHLGAQTIVGTSARSALSTFESNIRGTWNLLEACRNCAKTVERIVVASSDKAYGCHDQLPYTEQSPLQGRFPYDVSKSCADLIAFSYFHTYGLPLAITRCGNLYGGGDLNFNRLVPGTIRSAIRDQAPVIRSDGKFTRDYFYVADAVHAYLLLAQKLPDPEFCGQAFNFGNEQPLSVIELVDLVLDLLGKKESLQPRILNQASHEIRNQYLDCSKARKWLEWSPKHSVEEGLSRTIEWYQGYLGCSDATASMAHTGLS